MGKLVDDAEAVANAANALVAEAVTTEAEQEGGTVTDKAIAKVTVFYVDGSAADFSPPATDTPASPVVSPVTDEPAPVASETEDSTSTPDTSGNTASTEPVPEGGAEIQPTIAGVVPGQS